MIGLGLSLASIYPERKEKVNTCSVILVTKYNITDFGHIDQYFYNICKVKNGQKSRGQYTCDKVMAAVSPAILRAIGYVLAVPGHVEIPDYIRNKMVEVSDGSHLYQISPHRELSLSLLCGVILQSDPDLF